MSVACNDLNGQYLISAGAFTILTATSNS
jgi:hypothetical protein